MSKSMLVALVALFFSLTGWGVAARVALAPPNTVGTQQIVNGSVRLVDLHPSATRLLKGQRGERGPQGLTGTPGTAGPAGPQGSAGGFDPGKVSYVAASPQTSVGPSSSGVSKAVCPSGSIPVGGGGLSGIGKIGISQASADPWGWSIYVYNDTSITISIAALAVCAAP